MNMHADHNRGGKLVWQICKIKILFLVQPSLFLCLLCHHNFTIWYTVSEGIPHISLEKLFNLFSVLYFAIILTSVLIFDSAQDGGRFKAEIAPVPVKTKKGEK